MRRTIAAVAIASVAAFGVTSTASAAPTKKPPKSCARALNAAEDVDSIASEAFTNIGTFFEQTQQSATANSGGSIPQVTAFLVDLRTNIDEMTGKLTALKTEIDDARLRFVTAASACRAGK